MNLTTKCIPASRLSTDPDTADWLFEQAGMDSRLDPLEILMQREDNGEFAFHEEDEQRFRPNHN